MARRLDLGDADVSDVREVSEWHEAMEGSLTVAGERLSDSMDALLEASGVPKVVQGIAHSIGAFTVGLQYAVTHARLANTAEYQELKRAAEAEEHGTPDAWFARNRLALHVEMHMPPIGRR